MARNYSGMQVFQIGYKIYVMMYLDDGSCECIVINGDKVEKIKKTSGVSRKEHSQLNFSNTLQSSVKILNR